MAHMHYETDYTVANQVKALVEENTEQKNTIIDLQRDLRKAQSDLKFIRAKRQKLEEELARLM